MDEQLKKRVRELKLEYGPHPQKELLIAMPNPYPDREYEGNHFLFIFPVGVRVGPGQPDYATLTIKYVPDKQILELKSLKFYLASYRMVEIFYEEATNRILEDLVNTVKPRRMEILAEWNIRGGVGTKVKVSYNKKS